MSLIGSLFAFVLIPLKAKPPAPKEVENLALLAMADELRRTTFALNYWRDTGIALIEENERIKRQRDALSAQLRSLADLQGRQLYAYAQQQQAIAGQQAQANALAQQAYSQGLYQRHALGQQQNAYALCNCVPSRAQAFDNENTHRQEG